MTLTAGPDSSGAPSAPGRATPRAYLMCPPTYFDVVYAINEWMDPSVQVDADLAAQQWLELVRTLRALGHHVEVVAAVPGLPDMVFVADSGLVLDGVVMGARYRSPLRAPEAEPVLRWFGDNGFRRLIRPRHVNEGGGDFLVVGRTILAGTGFRTDRLAHREVAAALRREVVTLELVDPTYYHLNTALGVLDDDTITYLPGAFTPDSVSVLRDRYPDAVVADESDAAWLGLNLVSDGYNVVLPAQATGLVAQLRERGYRPVPVDFSQFRKAGGGIRCATLELHGVRWVGTAL